MRTVLRVAHTDEQSTEASAMDVRVALSDEPGARHSQVYANHGQRTDDAHRGRSPLRTNERGECPDEYPPANSTTWVI